MRTRKTLLTAEELFHLPTSGRLELVSGELYERPPAGARHFPTGTASLCTWWRRGNEASPG